MSSRTIVALLLMLSAYGIERASYYGSRALITADLMASGAGASGAPSAFMAVAWTSLMGVFIGGAASWLLGPRATAVLAVLLEAIGGFIVATQTSLFVGWAVVSIGAGMMRVVPFTFAAEVFAFEVSSDPARPPAPAPSRFTATTAFVLGMSVLANIGSMSAAAVKPLQERLGLATTHHVFAALALVSMLFSGGAAILGLLGRDAKTTPAPGAPYRSLGSGPPPSDPMPAPFDTNKALAGVAIVGIPGAIYALTSLNWSALYRHDHSIAEVGVVITWASGAATFTTFIMAIIFIVFAAMRSRTTPLLPYAALLIVCGVGLLLEPAAGVAFAVLVAHVVLVEVGTTAFAIGGVYCAVSYPGRRVALVVAAWLVATTVATNVGTSISAVLATLKLDAVLSVALGLAAIAAGIVYSLNARKIQAKYFAG